jgi:hypothetical protein
MLIVASFLIYYWQPCKTVNATCNRTRTLFIWWIDRCLSDWIFGTSVFNYYKLLSKMSVKKCSLENTMQD